MSAVDDCNSSCSPPTAKRLKLERNGNSSTSAKMEETAGHTNIDEGLYSRQLYVSSIIIIGVIVLELYLVQSIVFYKIGILVRL